MATILTTADIAADLDTTPRNLRKFLRSDDSGFEQVGKGSRYAIEGKDMRSLRTRFAKWTAAQVAAREAKAAAALEAAEGDDDAADADEALDTDA